MPITARRVRPFGKLEDHGTFDLVSMPGVDHHRDETEVKLSQDRSQISPNRFDNPLTEFLGEVDELYVSSGIPSSRHGALICATCRANSQPFACSGSCYSMSGSNP